MVARLLLGKVDKEFVDYFIDKDESDLIEHVNPMNGMVLKIKQFQNLKKTFMLGMNVMILNI